MEQHRKNDGKEIKRSHGVYQYLVRRKTMVTSDNRPRYKGVCPVCGKVMWICKSWAMEMGINIGAGTCAGCGTLIHMTLNAETQEMDLERYEDYIPGGKSSV